MFVRVKSTKNSPRKSVQIVASQRINGKVQQKIIKHIGVAKDDNELEELKSLAYSMQAKLEYDNQLPIHTPQEIEKLNEKYRNRDTDTDNNTSTNTNTNNDNTNKDFNINLLDITEEERIIKGIHDIYGKLYKEIGFDKVLANPARNIASTKVLKEIVLARIANPDSKRRSVSILEEKFGVNLNLKTVYRMMDKLDDKQIIKLNKIVLNKTKSLFKDKIDVIYFDATTLYFESFNEDEFKQNGYSKDNKFNQSQVVLALLVTKQGLPIGYKAFEGSTFDGHTLIPSLQDVREEFKVDNIVYVADSGMFNKKNLEEFEEKEYTNITYIVGARIKNMSKDIKEDVLNKDDYEYINDDKKVKTIKLDNNKKLLVSYSHTRARKDKYERNKAIDKLKAKLEKDKSIKSHLSNQGYKKYLLLEPNDEDDNINKSKNNDINKGEGNSEGKGKGGDEDKDNNMKNKTNKTSCNISIVLNEDKIKEDEQWDGLKGIITNNTKLKDKELLSQYANLWQVEESFRITKHDLKIRPIYHYKPSRVKAHLAISFMAYTLVRHLEYRVRLQYVKLSPEKIRQILLSIQTSVLYDTRTSNKFAMPSKVSNEAKKIYKLMGVNVICKPYIIKQ